MWKNLHKELDTLLNERASSYFAAPRTLRVNKKAHLSRTCLRDRIGRSTTQEVSRSFQVYVKEPCLCTITALSTHFKSKSLGEDLWRAEMQEGQMHAALANLVVVVAEKRVSVADLLLANRYLNDLCQEHDVIYGMDPESITRYYVYRSILERVINRSDRIKKRVLTKAIFEAFQGKQDTEGATSGALAVSEEYLSYFVLGRMVARRARVRNGGNLIVPGKWAKSAMLVARSSAGIVALWRGSVPSGDWDTQTLETALGLWDGKSLQGEFVHFSKALELAALLD